MPCMLSGSDVFNVEWKVCLFNEGVIYSADWDYNGHIYVSNEVTIAHTPFKVNAFVTKATE